MADPQPERLRAHVCRRIADLGAARSGASCPAEPAASVGVRMGLQGFSSEPAAACSPPCRLLRPAASVRGDGMGSGTGGDNVSTGAQVATVSTGAQVATVSTGAQVATVSTGAQVATVSTGAQMATVGTMHGESARRLYHHHHHRPPRDLLLTLDPVLGALDPVLGALAAGQEAAGGNCRRRALESPCPMPAPCLWPGGGGLQGDGGASQPCPKRKRLENGESPGGLSLVNGHGEEPCSGKDAKRKKVEVENVAPVGCQGNGAMGRAVQDMQLRIQTQELVNNYIVPCMNCYGICIKDNFLGEGLGSKVLLEVLNLHQNGTLMDGKVVSPLSIPTRSIRGDKIAWVDGKEQSCTNIGLLMARIDELIIYSAGRLGSYMINGRTKLLLRRPYSSPRPVQHRVQIGQVNHLNEQMGCMHRAAIGRFDLLVCVCPSSAAIPPLATCLHGPSCGL
ncbi:uncharacterized protein LOC121272723 isoform X2 [Carcharodon carcharias]|uniref:uncharacterized protein LOC121272723 isoform X2 n=1 Tax=Carcharodon carcharias TaxID=13397 RepID=UPI001B7DE7B3|nr:uncharacterized protein LOC121272723 isoform X2 [Carcharodon carcharias]